MVVMDVVCRGRVGVMMGGWELQRQEGKGHRRGRIDWDGREEDREMRRTES